MRKEELIASIQKLILKQSPTQDSLKFVHPKVVETEIAKAYRSVAQMFYSNDVNLMNAEFDFYSKKYTKTVKIDSDKRFYVDLPAKIISLKNNLGLRYVKPKGGDFSFIRTRENELDVVRKLPVYCCMKDAYFYLDGNKVMFDFPIPEHRLIEEVYVKLLPEFEEFEDSDNISIPGGDSEAQNMILQFMGFRPSDNVNDDVK